MTTEVTYSVCPVCGRKIQARRVKKSSGEVTMEKECPEHGSFSTVLWRGHRDWEEWRGEPPAEIKEPTARRDPKTESVSERNSAPDAGPDCGSCRGLCREHLRQTCCTLLEVTGRCQMRCTFCFAGECKEEDPPLERVKAWIFDLTVPGQTFLQLSGGEPTLRDDLPEIVSFAAKCGCRYIQLNSNGLRLAEEEDYVRRLAEAGLSFVFLQFDGLDDDIYRKLRKRPMMDVKRRAIENCAKYGIGVTLVPVIVPGVNEHQIGDIIRFGIRRSPAIRGIHFQPVSYFGRIPALPRNEDRFTLDQLLKEVVEQTGGRIRPEHLIPSCCNHPMCGFHGDFVVLPDFSLMALTAKRSRVCCGPEEPGFDPAEKNREFIGRRWKRRGQGKDPQETGSGEEAASEATRKNMSDAADMTDMDQFLDRVRTHGFTITSMDFQDAENLDYERLRRCSLHVYRRGRLIPFCAAYLTKTAAGENGRKNGGSFDKGNSRGTEFGGKINE